MAVSQGATAATPTSPAVVRLGTIAELARRKRVVVDAGDTELLVLCVRRRFTVVENRCPHLGLPLDDARVVGRTLVCASHGYKYALNDGGHIPGWRCPGGQVGRLRLVPTRVEGDALYALLSATTDPQSTTDGE